MTHAVIVDPPVSHQQRDQPGEAFLLRGEQLSSGDRDYFRNRAAQEAEAARSAGCGEARIAHEKLATAYWKLCSSDGAGRSGDAKTMYRADRSRPKAKMGQSEAPSARLSARRSSAIISRD